MTTPKKPPNDKRGGKPVVRNTREQRQTQYDRFLRSSPGRQFKQMLTLAREAATYAEGLAERIPRFLEDGAFGWMLFPHTTAEEMVRDLKVMSYVARIVADAIESETPVEWTAGRKKCRR